MPDEISSTPAPAPESSAPAPAETPVVSQPATPSSEAAQTPAASPEQPAQSSDETKPKATDPAITPDATPGETTPEHGVNPDKGIDPDAGDTPKPVETPTDSADPSKMTEAQKNAFYYQLRQNATKATTQALDNRYQPENVDDVRARFVEEGATDFEAQILADREIDKQRAELAEIRAEVSDLNASLGIEAIEVVSQIPWLNPAQKDMYGDGKLATLASQLYESFVVRDARTEQIDPITRQPVPGTGVIIEAKLTPMQFYGALDRIRSSGISDAGVKAQRAAEQQMAAVAPPTSVTTSRAPDFDNMSAKEQKAHLEAQGHVFN